MVQAAYGLKTKVLPVKTYHNLREGPEAVSNDEPMSWYQAYVTASLDICELLVEISHRCHDPFCFRPDHLCLELKIVNERRKSCSGPSQDGVCGCMRTFAAPFPEGCITADWLASVSCLRDPNGIKHTRTNPATNRVWDKYPRLGVFLDSPFWPTNNPDDIVKARLKAIETKLVQTGLSFIDFPHAFLDFRKLDSFLLEARPEAQTGSTRRTAYDRAEAWRCGYIAKALPVIEDKWALLHRKALLLAASDVAEPPGVATAPDPKVEEEAPATSSQQMLFVSPPRGTPNLKSKRRGPQPIGSVPWKG
jgi:hypothetical protein